MTKKEKKTQIYPLLPVRDIVIFPYMFAPLSVGRRRSLNAISHVKDKDKMIVVVAQKNIYDENPSTNDIYKTGVLARVVETYNMPDGSARVVIEGIDRIVIRKFFSLDDIIEVEVENVPVIKSSLSDNKLKAIMRRTSELFEEYVRMNPKIDIGSYGIMDDIDSPDKLADIITSYLRMKKHKAQKLLEDLDPVSRLEKISIILKKEIDILAIQIEIDNKVQNQINKTQKEYILSEQMKAIKLELEGKEAQQDDAKELENKIKKSGMSSEAEKQSLKELSRLKKMMPFTPEATVSRTYLDWLIKLPWNKKTSDSINLKKAGEILENDHQGLSEAKERILEYLAVSKLSKKLKTPILCFVGPPGTGKTSFGRSIAHALGRKFVRVSLGGIRDEAEIRGHRRTYIGALPGRIIQSIAKIGSNNPVFLLDEIDKMGKDFRGDPSSALLEALDPEQNRNFSDHYLEVDFDLSNVMFITTANTVATIPPAMLDRMEMIEFSGYTPDEKINIAQRFLIPKQIKENGMSIGKFNFTDGAVMHVINHYTREAGVRNLEREIGKILRKTAADVASGSIKSKKYTAGIIAKYLGVTKFTYNKAHRNTVGIAAGLSWTQNGGESLSIEVSLMPGDGKLQLTGTLGDVMKESAQTALSYIRANSKTLGVSSEFYKNSDIHIHVPAGAIPKEGPSAGITICTALLSRIKNKPVKDEVVMTGEITLSGKILEIGGLKEKILAAHRDGFKTVIYPQDNKKHLVEIPNKIKRTLKFIPVDNYKEVIKHAF